MILLGSTKFGGKEYSITDVKGFVSNESKKLPTGFYGGRVNQLAKTNIKGMYLCMEKMNVIDILFPGDELKDLTKDNIELVLDAKGKDIPSKATKDELIKLL